MTNEEQRIAIGRVCGYVQFERYNRSGKPQADGVFLYGTKDVDSINYPRNWERLPDYLSDLNAMHEAEKTLDEREQYHFVDCLYEVISEQTESGYISHWPQEVVVTLLIATAAQRAKAFLLAKRLWTKV